MIKFKPIRYSSGRKKYKNVMGQSNKFKFLGSLNKVRNKLLYTK